MASEGGPASYATSLSRYSAYAEPPNNKLGDLVSAVPSAGDIEISTDISRIDVQAVHAFLTSSYWAKDRSIETVETSLKNSLCFGAYIAGKQVAFGRIVTDYSTFAYLVDIFVLPAHRGQGISKKLLSAMIAYPRLQGVGMLLRTRDAHGLYAQFGFKPPTDPSMLMVMLNVPKAAGSPNTALERGRER